MSDDFESIKATVHILDRDIAPKAKAATALEYCRLLIAEVERLRRIEDQAIKWSKVHIASWIDDEDLKIVVLTNPRVQI